MSASVPAEAVTTIPTVKARAKKTTANPLIFMLSPFLLWLIGLIKLIG
jgi:hypothetical protein